MTSRLNVQLHIIIHHLWPLGAVPRLLIIFAAVLWLTVSPLPRTEVASIVEGRTASVQGDYTAAADAYQYAVAYRPWSADHLRALTQAELLAGRPESAAHHLEVLQALRPLSPSETLWWPAIYALQSDPGDIQPLDPARLAGVPPAELTLYADLMRDLAAASINRADWPTAYAAYHALAATGQMREGEVYTYGLLAALQSPNAATDILSRVASSAHPRARRIASLLSALDARPTLPTEQWYVRLGTAYLGLNEPHFAEEAFHRAVLHNVLYGEALAYYAYVRTLQGEPALSAAMQAAALSPDQPVVHYLNGLTWKELARPYQARRSFQRAFTLDPDNPAFAIEIASSHRLANELTLAEAWMVEAARLAEENYEWRLRLASFYIDEEYQVAEQGVPLAEALVEERPEDAEAHAVLGWGYFLLGDLDRAFIEMDTALALDDTLARAHAHRGVLLESQDRNQEAIASYTRAVQLDPDGPFGAFARRALSRLTSDADE